MPLQATSGAASYDAFGGGVAAVPNYIEDVFSTWLYTGNSSTQTITNGIDLAGKGGLVWIKNRTLATDHILGDTARGASVFLRSNTSDPQSSTANHFSSFNSNGFSIGSNANVNASTYNYASWTFREQPKFFDVVTWTGNGVAGRQISHALGSVPGCIIVKSSSNQVGWAVYHRQLNSGTNPQNFYLTLNATTAQSASSGFWNNTAPTSSDFTVGTSNNVNGNGITYVAYLFAHNAGGFGLTGTDNVISCGSYTGTGSTGNIQTLGYEPQFLLIKNSGASGGWAMLDNMRRIVALPDTNADSVLYANTSAAEDSSSGVAFLTATGFGLKGGPTDSNASGDTYIYIAIRRGPMRVPTTGTSVLGLNARTGTGSNTTVTGGSSVSDLTIIKNRGTEVFPSPTWASRLTGSFYFGSSSSAAQAESSGVFPAQSWDVMNGVKVGTSQFLNASANTYINYLFSRAPSFMDVCCYTGTGVARNINHNLQSVPELIIVKARSVSNSWTVYSSTIGAANYLYVDSTAASSAASTMWDATTPTASVFRVGTNADTNGNGTTYVSYLFASCPGVSKVGSFTGTGATQVIDCGFTGGARFVLIKSTSASGAWYVWDSARGIVAGNDPYLRLNSTAAEVTNTDWVDTAATGFELSNAGGNLANSNGVTYIFLAIA
jgi:hypothetical protein